MSKKASHCDQCTHATLKWYVYRGGEPFDVLICDYHHKPRFYRQRHDNPLDDSYGWGKVCADFEAAGNYGEMNMQNETNSGTTTGAASELSAGLGAVLTYRNDGRAGVGGQQVGADGAGTYAVLFMGDPYEAAGAAREYVSRLRGRIRDVVVVTNEPMYLGPAITVVEAPNVEVRGG